MTKNVNWEKILVDEPIKAILGKFKNKMVDVDEAAKGMDCVGELAGSIAKSKGSTLPEQTHWRNDYICHSLFNALADQKGGYKAVAVISKKSSVLSEILDVVENEYGGSRMTWKMNNDPRNAIIAEKLLKARAAHRKKLAQTP